MSASYCLGSDNKTACGCGVFSASNGATAGITYCPTHAAADEFSRRLFRVVVLADMLRHELRRATLSNRTEYAHMLLGNADELLAREGRASTASPESDEGTRKSEEERFKARAYGDFHHAPSNLVVRITENDEQEYEIQCEGCRTFSSGERGFMYLDTCIRDARRHATTTGHAVNVYRKEPA